MSRASRWSSPLGRRAVVLVALALFVGACGDDDAAPRRVDTPVPEVESVDAAGEALAAARQRWDDADRGVYRYEIEWRSCLCPAPRHGVVQVSGGVVSDVDLIVEKGDIEWARVNIGLTMEELFDMIEAGLGWDDPGSIDLVFHETTGAPTYVSIDPSRSTLDEEFGWALSFDSTNEEPPIPLARGTAIAGAEARRLLQSASGDFEAYFNALAAMPSNDFYGRLGDDEAIAYHIELMLREDTVLADRISSAAAASDADVLEIVEQYIDDEVLRLAEAGFTGEGTRETVVFLRDNLHHLRPLVEPQDPVLACPLLDQIQTHLVAPPAFPGWPTPEEAVAGSLTNFPPSSRHLSVDDAVPISTDDSTQIWLVAYPTGDFVVEVDVTRHNDGWYATVVTYCH